MIIRWLVGWHGRVGLLEHFSDALGTGGRRQDYGEVLATERLACLFTPLSAREAKEVYLKCKLCYMPSLVAIHNEPV